MDSKDIIETLNDLIETSKDGEYGFRTCAEHSKSADLRAVFERRAQDCASAVRELQAQVTQLGGKADDSGSASGAVHRGWVAMKGKLTGYDDLAMLEECERGEDVALERYRTAREKTLPEPVRSLVDKQYEGAKRNHNQVRDLRDQYRAVKV